MHLGKANSREMEGLSRPKVESAPSRSGQEPSGPLIVSEMVRIFGSDSEESGQFCLRSVKVGVVIMKELVYGANSAIQGPGKNDYVSSTEDFPASTPYFCSCSLHYSQERWQDSSRPCLMKDHFPVLPKRQHHSVTTARQSASQTGQNKVSQVKLGESLKA